MHRAEHRVRAALAAAAVVILFLVLAVAAAAATAPHAAPTPAASPARHRGSITMEPGYYPPNDPESSSVRLGRRIHARLVSKRFAGGALSLNDLGRRVCHALDYPTADSLFSLAVREDEFRDILWPEFPQSRPATGISWRDGWLFLYGRLHQGCGQAVRDHGGHGYQFVRFDRCDSTLHYRNFNLHNGLILVARDETGQSHEFRWLRAAVERKGRYKIYSMTD